MNILFVCAGNTCRSCMAEAIMNHIKDIEDLKVFSAGIAVSKGSRTSKNSAAVVEFNTGINISQREAVHLDAKALQSVDLVLTMTYNIKSYLIGLFPNYKDKIFNLNEYVGVEGEISDPYGGDISVYNATYNALHENLNLLLTKLKEGNSI